jgi:hypothetical protein
MSLQPHNFSSAFSSYPIDDMSSQLPPALLPIGLSRLSSLFHASRLVASYNKVETLSHDGTQRLSKARRIPLESNQIFSPANRD